MDSVDEEAEGDDLIRLAAVLVPALERVVGSAPPAPPPTQFRPSNPQSLDVELLVVAAVAPDVTATLPLIEAGVGLAPPALPPTQLRPRSPQSLLVAVVCAVPLLGSGLDAPGRTAGLVALPLVAGNAGCELPALPPTQLSPSSPQSLVAGVAAGCCPLTQLRPRSPQSLAVVGVAMMGGIEIEGSSPIVPVAAFRGVLPMPEAGLELT